MTPERARKVGQARHLREQGLTFREIGERMGLATTTAAELVSDPELTGVRRRQAKYRRPCEECGKLLNPQGKHGGRLCIACTGRARAAPHLAAKDAALEDMWARGMTGPQIAEQVGWADAGAEIARARARGANLPYRRPDRVEFARDLGTRRRVA